MADEKAKRNKSERIHAVIDRIEDNEMAVVYLGDDEENQIDLPVSFLPEGAAGGDHLRITITLDKVSRGQAEDRVKKLQEELKKRAAPPGQKDFKL
jgi:hypothetical protein